MIKNSKKHRREISNFHSKQSSAHKNVFLVFTLMFFSVFLMGNVSAAEWDNVMTYEKEDMKVTITNAFNLPFIGYDLGSVELKSHSSVNHVKQVGFGKKEVVMFYDFTDWELYEDGLGEVYFTDKRTGKEIEKDYTFVEWVVEDVIVNDYDDYCSTIEVIDNCDDNIIGNHIESIGRWKELTKNDIPNRNTRIGLKTYVAKDDYMDGVWTIAGKKLTRHAVWESSLNVGLLTVYSLDETSGTNLVNNVTFTNNGTARNGTIVGAPGHLANSVTFDGTDDLIDMPNFVRPNEISICAWVFPTEYDNKPVDSYSIVGGDDGSGGGSKERSWTFTLGDTLPPVLRTVFYASGSVNLATNGVLPLSVWTHTCLTYTSGNLSLWTNGKINVSDSSRTGNMDGGTGIAIGASSDTEFDPNLFFEGSIDQVIIWNESKSEAEIKSLYNLGVGVFYLEAEELIVNLNSPIDNFNTSNPSITFNGTVSDPNSIGTTNVSLFLDDVLNETNSTGVNDSDYFFSKIVSDGIHTWNYQACDFNNVCTNGTARTFTIDQTSPTLNITFPTEVINFHEVNNNLFVNWTVNDINLDACVLQSGGTNTTVTCNDNQTTINITNIVNNSIILFVNDTLGNSNSTTQTWEYLSFQNSEVFTASTFETESETFMINITTNGTAPTSASLIYNGTEFTGATITSLSGNDYNISRNIDIPLINGATTPFHFNFSILNTEIATSSSNQEVNLTTFEFCEIGQQPAYINFTFTNETVAEEEITAEIDSTWNFWLGGGSVLDSLTFSNTSENSNYQFCLTSGGNRTLNANVSLSYDNSLSQQRNFVGSFTLSNTTTTQNLFLLPTANGIFVTFQVVDAAERVISGVAANVTKGGTLIASGTTDDAGLITYFLDPDTSYVFSFSKTGFQTVTTTLVPTQTSFTITMSSAAVISQFDTTRGINYQIRPIDLTLINGTLVEFNLTLDSSFHTLSQFGFVLKNSTGTVFNVTISTTGTGGFLSQTLDTQNNTDIIMEVFWTITNNQTNVTRTWLVFSLENEGFSILTFFNDLSTFLTSGMFGLTDFGLGIIIFLIILISTGVVSFKYGITSPPGISIIVFSLVAFFDVALGIMPNPVNAIPNFPTIFVGLIFLGTLYSEVVR